MTAEDREAGPRPLRDRGQTPAPGHADDLSVEVVPGCGHYLHEERPDLVARAAERLFSGTG
ncbi:alpha/beta fold hydrolase [Streptomyces sp. NPDC102490]|jgi:pimeloyl-ACP methyl ester carboxylesterase|uniref:alpha/beta fold hydrolase n=1 Tax=Streptomyces sp. NPDC102490 TaxID=3366183 RepID=UPI0037FA2EE4